jgi:hypothetical protein
MLAKSAKLTVTFLVNASDPSFMFQKRQGIWHDKEEEYP